MTKLCARGKSAAKRKFKVYPSAYANAYASKICAGKIKDPSGVKRKDFKGPKPSGAKVGMAVTAGSQSGMGRLQKSGLAKAKKGAMMIIIGVGKPKKANDGVFIKKPVPSPMAREKTVKRNTAQIKYQRELKEYYDATGKKPRPRRTKKMNTGGDAKIKKVIKGLKKASKLHAAQAKTLKTVKVRGGGMAIQGMNFKGVY